MIVADAKYIEAKLKNLIKNNKANNRITGKMVKLYCEIFWDLEKKHKKYSGKEHKKICEKIIQFETENKGKNYSEISDIKLYLTRCAKDRIYLNLKEKYND